MNDIERAIEHIEVQYKGIDYSKGKDMVAICIYDKQAEETIKALKKQIPKKLKYRNFYQGYRCDCGANLPFQMQKYCCDCGQKLDWRVEE